MPNSAICSGSGTGVGAPPDDEVPGLPLLLPPELDPPHFLLNQHPHVALAGAAAAIIVAAPSARNILFIFIIIPLCLIVADTGKGAGGVPEGRIRAFFGNKWLTLRSLIWLLSINPTVERCFAPQALRTAIPAAASA